MLAGRRWRLRRNPRRVGIDAPPIALSGDGCPIHTGPLHIGPRRLIGPRRHACGRRRDSVPRGRIDPLAWRRTNGIRRLSARRRWLGRHRIVPGQRPASRGRRTGRVRGVRNRHSRLRGPTGRGQTELGGIRAPDLARSFRVGWLPAGPGTGGLAGRGDPAGQRAGTRWIGGGRRRAVARAAWRKRSLPQPSSHPPGRPGRHLGELLSRHLVAGVRVQELGLAPACPRAPDPACYDNDVTLGQRCHPAQDPRLGQVAQLGPDQLRQSLALQDWPGDQPGSQARRKYVEPDQRVVERQSEHGKEHHVGHGDRREHGDLANRQRHGQPEVVQLVQPLFDPPNARVGGQIHLMISFRLPLQALGCSGCWVVSGRQGRARCPWRASARCRGHRRSPRWPRRARRTARIAGSPW